MSGKGLGATDASPPRYQTCRRRRRRRRRRIVSVHWPIVYWPIVYVKIYLVHFADEEGGDADELFALTGRCTLLGRSAAAVDVVLKDTSISRQHAAIIHADGTAFLQDLGSASGSRVDGVRLAANGPCVRCASGASTF